MVAISLEEASTVRVPSAVWQESGFDATALLHQLQRDSIFSFSAGTTTSQCDVEALIAAAKEELRRTRGSSLAQQSKANLAGTVVGAGDGSFTHRLAQFLHDAGVVQPSVTIEYQNLSVEADALVGSASTPSLGNAFMGCLKRATLQGGLKTQKFEILKNMHGVLRPGSITLLLGPPGSGKSVFLQTLSGRLQSSSGVRISGSIKYNGESSDAFVLRRTVALVDQMDYHIPNLTVLETCQFAHDCMTDNDAAARFMALSDKLLHQLDGEEALAHVDKMHAEAEAGQAGTVAGLSEGEEAKEAAEEAGKPDDGGLAGTKAVADGGRGYDAEFVEQMRELIKHKAKPHVILKVLGLSEVADTVVGDSMTRGISGGQRKRVTTAEILSGPQSVVLMDEISTGLDSATTFSVIRSFAETAHAMKRTFLISLLQPAPEVVQLFDDILLLTDGRVVYHGPVGEVLPFFERQLDFSCPVRKDVGSFLQEVTTPVGQFAYATPALLARKGRTEADQDPTKLIMSPPKEMLTPVEEMEQAFWTKSQWGQEAMQQLTGKPFNPADATRDSLQRTRFASGWPNLTRLVLKRQLMLNRRDRAFYIARAMQAVVLALIMASLWATINVEVSEGRQVMALCSLSVQLMIVMSMPQIGMVFANKRVFYKQRDSSFFPASSYVLSFLVTQLPQSSIEATLFSVILYFISGLTRTAGNFFLFLLVLFSISNCMAGFYRLIAYSVPSMVVANASGALSLLFLMITNGFSIVRGSIPVYLIWVYWMNPISWAVRALVANELGSGRWDVPVSEGSTESVGQFCADQFDFYLGYQWVWGSVGVSWAWLAVFTVAGAFAMRFSKPASPKPTVPEEEDKKEVEREIVHELEKRDTLRRLSSSPPAGTTSAAAAAATDGAAAPAELQAAAPPAAGMATARVAKAVVEFTPITLVCRNIRYYVNDPSKGTAPGVVKDSTDKEIAGKLELLKGLDFFAEPGSLTALMGGSGAGKTTLLDCVLGRKTVGLIRGDILVNGHPKEQGPWSRVCGYVEQQDNHSAGTTVREALQFSARLRLTPDVSAQQVVQLVEETLEMVDLTSLQTSIVGYAGGEGLSIEQRKRLSIAVELVANPSVVFMDEPTSGLDARAAAIVMRSVKNVSLSMRTVVVTIHQPSMDIFEAFDQLVLLQRGGRLTYFGSLGLESRDLIAYLEGQPGVEPIRAGYNPATWMLEVTGGSMSTVFAASSLDFPTLYMDSELRQQNDAKAARLAEEGAATHTPLSLAGQFAQPLHKQAAVLTRKWFSLYWRNPNYNFVRFTMTVAIGIIVGLVYLNQGDLGPSGSVVTVSRVQNIMGMIFMLTVFLGMFNCMTVQPVMAEERVVFYRERASSYYSSMPYAVASGLVELPYLATQAFLMVAITYWMVGFERLAWKFFYFLFLYFLSLTMFTFFGQFLVFATPNQLLAQLLAGFTNQIWSIFAGFMVPYPVMPAGWKWMNRLSPTTWTIAGLVGSQLSDRSDVLMEGYTPGQTVPVSVFMDQAFGYSFDMIWWCCLIVFAYCAFFRGASTLLLKFVNFQKR